MFDSIPISVVFLLKARPCSLQCYQKVGCAIDQKHRVLGVPFLVSP